MVSASPATQAVAASFHALEAGALAVLAKPPGPGHPEHAAATDELLRTIKVMAEVGVVKRWKKTGAGAAAAPAYPLRPPPRPAQQDLRLVAIGASTGGPLALQTILARLRQPFGAPVLIVQHISPGFVDGLVEWLGRSCEFDVRIAVHGEQAQSGRVYLAPDGVHMAAQSDGRIVLTDAAAEHGVRPAVSCLFRSVAAQYGAYAAGVLLTGMGRDGAQELKDMRDAGALTIAQDRDSSIVHGMPGEAVKLGAAQHVLAPEAIAALLNMLKPGAP